MMKRFLIFLTVFFNTLFFLAAIEYDEGSIRLVLNENTGRFSLYTWNADLLYDPLFTSNDPRTSFISVNINDRNYKLGDNSAFKTSMGDNPDRPSFIFESSQAKVTEQFAFIKTANSAAANGVAITITVENISAQEIKAGFRFLVDTDLGERGAVPHFYTEGRIINSETLIVRGGTEEYWVSAGNSHSLMGSIIPPEGDEPDSIHFANWKRLTDVNWKVPFNNGRSFNSLPYSVNDSAVCYYYEPRNLAPGEKYTVTILLAAGDSGFANVSIPGPGFTADTPAASIVEPVPQAVPQTPAPVNQPAVSAIQMEWDLAVVQDIIRQIDENTTTGAITQEEITAMEQTLEEIRIRYGIGIRR